MELAPQLVERLIYGFGSHRRQTQDSPVLPDVWAYFATPSADRRERDPLVAPRRPRQKKGKGKKDEEQPLELLLTPHFDAGPATLAKELRIRLEKAREEAPKKDRERRLPRKIAYTQSYVAARLYFDEVPRLLIPLTPWWRQFVWKGMFRDADADSMEDRTLRDLRGFFKQRQLVKILEEWGRTQSPEALDRSMVAKDEYWLREPIPLKGFERKQKIEDDLLWMVRIIGTIQWARQLDAAVAEDLGLLDEAGRVAYLPAKESDPDAVDYGPIVDAGTRLLDIDLPVVQARQPSLWQINRNRPASPAVKDSRKAIKADAAIRLFDISCRKLAWAVIDSGIDASHPVFLREDEPNGEGSEEETPPSKPWHRRTRIKKTYDFTRLRPLLDQEIVREILNAEDVLNPFLEPEVKALLDPLLQRLHLEEVARKAEEEASGGEREPFSGPLGSQLGDLRKRLENGREIDWAVLDALLEVPHHDPKDGEYRYPVPASGHGTHVAGILGGQSEDLEFSGICPDIWLYDLRVLDPHGPNDEFTVLAALQFVQHLNLQKEVLTIQGANLSLSIRHDVATYACGRTPVCEECERLVASGVVVVAAAGNAGWDDKLAKEATGAGYRTVSITDPGNAEAVITVGATHRAMPHTYGVSFFSSRGPTGDGRAKPDLVAPGEKITSVIPGERFKRDDGTSMAAPHVSGAAALLLARHQELIGQPQRVKEVLCGTATDLGRERHFQGAGMLDVLRALQSV